MKSLIHPTYFPSILSYAVILQSNAVLFETVDFYDKQTYKSRAYIHSANGKQMLSVQVKHTKKNVKQTYKDVRISYDFDWQKLHWRSLETAYRTSPYFEFYEDDLYPIFHQKEQFLLDLNLKTIETICDLLDVDLQYDRTESFQDGYADTKDFRFLNNAKKAIKADFPAYKQMFDDRFDFMPNLSILDLLFMEGPNTILYLEKIQLKSIKNTAK